MLFSYMSQAQETNDQKARKIFESLFSEYISLRPEFATSIGDKTNYDKWYDYSIEGETKVYHQAKDLLKTLRNSINVKAINRQNQLVYKLIQYELEQIIENYQWRVSEYPLTHMRGVHKDTVSLLVNKHLIETQEDAEAYIARLRGLPAVLSGVSEKLKRAIQNKVFAPKLTYRRIIDAINKIIEPLPLKNLQSDQLLFSDFKEKLGKTKISKELQTKLTKQAFDVINSDVYPAFKNFRDTVKHTESVSKYNDGLWKNPNGKEFYQNRLKYHTSTDLSSETIHELGLKEVARIHKEMNAIREDLGFKGGLREFFTHMRNNKKFLLPNNDSGRKQYIDSLQAYRELMKKNLHKAFGRLPITELDIRRVEPYREKNSSAAFYQTGAADGSIPGVYYANLADMKTMPTYLAESLFYHEAVPGHHLERSLSRERKNIPSFQKYFWNTAFIEGWALYSEKLAKELGGFKDPYSDFGRLNWELRRAIRLVVDTGLHYKGWSRDKAINYFKSNSSFPIGDVTNQIDRYLVWPGQATSYTIGMLKIEEFRKRANEKLKDNFSMVKFHDFILMQGPMPLSTLESQMDRWLSNSVNETH